MTDEKNGGALGLSALMQPRLLTEAEGEQIYLGMRAHRLKSLAKKIHERRDRVWRSNAPATRAQEIGYLLIYARGELDHGEWLPWLKKIRFPRRTAQLYIQIAGLPAGATVAHFKDARATLKEIATRRKQWELARLAATFEEGRSKSSPGVPLV
jgi:hypothetical protein